MALLSSQNTSISSFVDETLPSSNNSQQLDELNVSEESRMSNPLNAQVPALYGGSKKATFEKDALVFAKLSGHSDPPWPARVAKLCWNNGNHWGYEVFFYGTYQVGKVLANKVWKYNEVSMAKFSNPKITSLRKKTEFTRGLVEISDCPDIAPFSGVPESTGQIKSSATGVPESTSQIDKICIRRTANQDTWHLSGQKNGGNTESFLKCKPARNKEKDGEVGMNWESSSIMTGIRKVESKTKHSSWILEKSDQRLGQDTFTGDDEANDERSCISEPSRNAIRRSKRNRKLPYWRGIEAKNNELAARQIDEVADLKRFKLDKNVKSRAISRKKTPGGSKIQGAKTADGNQVKAILYKTRQKEIRNASVVGPSLSRNKNDDDQHSAKPQVFTSTPNRYTSSTDVSPRSQEKAHGQERLPDMDTDSTANQDTLQFSSPVAGRNLNRPNAKPGTKVDCVIVKEERASDDPKDWSVAQTISAIIRMEPSIHPEDIKVLRDHKVDGDALMKVKSHHFQDFVTYGKMKMGPAIKLEHLVDQLKTKSQE